MATINIVIQGKGGVGKTFTSIMIAQYLQDKGVDSTNIDTDPVNNSFSAYSSLSAQPLKIVENNAIKPKAFDDLMELLIETNKTVVIDNGASSFLPLVSYLLENECFEVLKDSGHIINIHSIIAGGQALADTMVNLDQMLQHLPPYVNFIVWLNEKDGDIAHNSDPNLGFEKSTIYTKNKARIKSVIHLPKPSQDQLLDLRKALSLKITLSEAIASADFKVMEKQRIKLYQRNVYQQLDNAIIFESEIKEKA
ncbi:MAG: Protein TraL [Acinetobacter bereziniae]|uniref:Protein TraL n=1 Tax=Acinetobacter bereziniae TaxID=106648 RepID=A0A833UF18_ACIBZ|nr:MAG: Protein TraL [Acinetobacter bereziniae]